MLGSISRRIRLLLRSELDLQKDRLINELPARLGSTGRIDASIEALGWKLFDSGDKLYVSGLNVTFDKVAHAHILRAFEALTMLVREAQAKLEVLPDGRVEFLVGSVRFVPETTQEVAIIAEIFCGEIYLVESESPMFVWDVGANVATASLYFAGVMGCEVAAYELFPPTAKAAAENIARSGMTERIRLTAAGVGGKSESRRLPYSSDLRGSNGLFGNDMVGAEGMSTEIDVNILDAAEVMDSVLKSAAGRPVLAKFDCEGAEYDIIDRLESKHLLGSIDAIVMELHAFPGLEPERAIASLTRAGFLIRRSRQPTGHLSIVYATRLRRCEPT